jgi:hypothetical protein
MELRIKSKDNEINAFKTEVSARKEAKDDKGKRIEIFFYQKYLGRLMNLMHRIKMA